jgi:serine/threonine protein kinase/Flp pilus assembly protein TadD
MSTSQPVPPQAPVVDDRTHQNWIGAGPPANAGRDVDPGTNVPAFASSRSDRVAEALKKLPNVGDECFGFKIVRELGRGSFGRVYLATQPELSGRQVALKVSADLLGESRTLAQLQHTNIVPVYSVHRSNGLQAVCMPYFGPVTFADLLKRYRAANTVPATGRQFVDTIRDVTNPTKQRTGPDVAKALSSVRPGLPDPAADKPEVKTDTILNMLSGLSYVRAVCWLGARVADGLAHAHDRGILHRDVKPANILLTEDGQPMLLDFGIAQDAKARTAAGGGSAVGGTLPYMSPEQLDEVRTEKPQADAKSDVYSLGVVLYELITGRYPWRVPSGTVADEVPKMIAERMDAPPPLRSFNKSVSPGLESIIHKCLSGDPARRYQSAAHLRDDLERYLADQPLKYAPERSLRERVHKWGRRNPKLTSTATLAVLSVIVLTGTAVGAAGYQQRMARLDAEQTLREFDEDFKSAQYLLGARSTDTDQLEASVARARAAFNRYRPDAPNWEQQPGYLVLSPDLRARVRADLAEACVLLARGHLRIADRTPTDPQPVREALRYNELAERLAGAEVANVVYRQREDILKRLGKADEAEAAAGKATATPLTTTQDFYLAANEHLARAQYKDAIPLFRKALDRDPRHYWSLLGLGVCQDLSGAVQDARGSYTAAIALGPEFPWGYFNRGIANVKLRDYDQAITDLTHAARLKPDLTDIYVNRALAHQGRNDFKAGIADLDLALEKGAPYTRIYFLRAKMKELAGDKDGAKRDLAEGLKKEPSDEKSWIARGYARMGAEPEAALVDFDHALALNPRSMSALQNKAHVLGKLGRSAECIKVQDRMLELVPDSAVATAGRGVIHARMKNWDAALKDARDALALSASPSNVYQVAGIFALLTQHDPVYKAEALTLLGAALRAGFGHDLLAIDKELDPIREAPEFKKLVNAVHDLKPAKPTR